MKKVEITRHALSGLQAIKYIYKQIKITTQDCKSILCSVVVANGKITIWINVFLDNRLKRYNFATLWYNYEIVWIWIVPFLDDCVFVLCDVKLVLLTLFLLFQFLYENRVDCWNYCLMECEWVKLIKKIVEKNKKSGRLYRDLLKWNYCIKKRIFL